MHHLNGQLVEETVRRKRSTGIPIFNTGTSLYGIRANVKKGGIKVGVGFGDVSKLHRAKGGAAQDNITGGDCLSHRCVEIEGACDEEYVSPMKQNLSFV